MIFECVLICSIAWGSHFSPKRERGEYLEKFYTGRLLPRSNLFFLYLFFVCVRRLSRLRFLRHHKTKEGKQFTWMLSRLLVRVWFGGKGGHGAREALSPQSPLTLFSHRLFAPAPLENPLTDYQLISGSRRLRKVGSKQNTNWKHLDCGFWRWSRGFKAMT